MSDQMALRLDGDGPNLMVRVHADQRVLRADCDWTLVGHEYRSSNGWAIRRAWIGRERNGWAAFAPDGVPEWWAADPFTAMARAEGDGS